jgi:hypothetical protein
MYVFGVLAGLLTFGVYYGFHQQYPETNLGLTPWSSLDTPYKVAAEGGLVSGLVLAVFWIVFPTILFIYTHMRWVVAAYVGYGTYAVYHGLIPLSQLHDQVELQKAAQHLGLWGSATAIVVLLIAWFLKPVFDYFGAFLPKVPQPADDSAPSASTAPAANIPMAEPAPAAPPPTSQTLAQAFSGLQDGAHQGMPILLPVLVGEQQRQPHSSLDTVVAAQVQSEMRRRRSQARMQAEMSFVLAIPYLGSSFTREMFDAFMQRYLSDELPPEEVEENGRRLQATLQEHLKKMPASVPSLPPIDWLRMMLEQQRIAPPAPTPATLVMPTATSVEPITSPTAPLPIARLAPSATEAPVRSTIGSPQTASSTSVPARPAVVEVITPEEKAIAEATGFLSPSPGRGTEAEGTNPSPHPGRVVEGEGAVPPGPS